MCWSSCYSGSSLCQSLVSLGADEISLRHGLRLLDTPRPLLRGHSEEVTAGASAEKSLAADRLLRRRQCIGCALPTTSSILTVHCAAVKSKNFDGPTHIWTVWTLEALVYSKARDGRATGRWHLTWFLGCVQPGPFLHLLQGLLTQLVCCCCWMSLMSCLQVALEMLRGHCILTVLTDPQPVDFVMEEEIHPETGCWKGLQSVSQL